MYKKNTVLSYGNEKLKVYEMRNSTVGSTINNSMDQNDSFWNRD